MDVIFLTLFFDPLLKTLVPCGFQNSTVCFYHVDHSFSVPSCAFFLLPDLILQTSSTHYPYTLNVFLKIKPHNFNYDMYPEFI